MRPSIPRRADDPGYRSPSSSTHGFGVADAVELARSLRRLPRRLDVYAIEAADLEAGGSLSPPVTLAVEQLAQSLAAAFRGA